MICKNCGKEFSGSYCNNCGQPAKTHRIDKHFLWHDIQHGLFHFDNGILFSFKQLFTRPGNSIREYIEGKRQKHFKPISLVLVLATVYGLLYHSFHINLIDTPNYSDGSIEINYLELNEWIAHHYAWVTLATIPLYTIGTKIAFRTQEYNFMEYFVLNSFKGSQRLFAHIALFPILYYFNGTTHLKTFSALLYALDIVLIYWTNVQFFNKLTKTKAFLLSLLSHLIFLALFTISLVIIVLIIELSNNVK